MGSFSSPGFPICYYLNKEVKLPPLLGAKLVGFAEKSCGGVDFVQLVSFKSEKFFCCLMPKFFGKRIV